METRSLQEYFLSLKRRFWNVNLVLTVIQSDINGFVGDSLAIAVWVEDVADSSSVSPWGVWNGNLLLIVRVGQSNEHVSSGESVEVVKDVFLLEIAVIRFGALSSLVNFSGHLVNVRVGVHVLPERFSVLRVVTTSVGLLRTIVIEWNTSGGESKNKCVFEHLLVVVLVQESGIVVVIDEDTKSGWVSEFLVYLLDSSGDSLHGLGRAEDILDGVVHWIVEKTGNEVLIWTDVVRVAVEAFTHLEDSCRLSVLSPEVLWDLRNGVDSDAIELVCLHELLDPVFEILSHIWVLLVQVWKARKPAILNFVLVVPVIDVAL